MTMITMVIITTTILMALLHDMSYQNVSNNVSAL